MSILPKLISAQEAAGCGNYSLDSDNLTIYTCIPNQLKRFIKASDIQAEFLSEPDRYRKSLPIGIAPQMALVAGVDWSNQLIIHMPHDPKGSYYQILFLTHLAVWVMNHTDYIVGIRAHGHQYSATITLDEEEEEEEQQKSRSVSSHIVFFS